MKNHSFEKPLSFGEILDVTFRVIKENFSVLFLIMLIFEGPLDLLRGIAKAMGGAALLRAPNTGQGFDSLLESLRQTESGTGLDAVYFILLLLISAPIAYASLIIATDQIRKKEPLKILSIIKRSFSRYWAILGGMFIYGLIMFALLFVFVLIVIALTVISGGSQALTGLAIAGPQTGLGIIIAIIVLSIIALCAFVYLMTRWSFFFAAIVFEKVSPGLRKSWKLTRGNFWRLVGLYIILSIITLILSLVFQAVVYSILGSSVLAYLLITLVSIPISMITYIAYAVIYFDLRIRNEAGDLKAMLEDYQDKTSVHNTAETVETK